MQKYEDKIKRVDLMGKKLFVEIEGTGTYELFFDESNSLFYLLSPQTGSYNYYYDQKEN